MRLLNQKKDFAYELPAELIAAYPLSDRTSSRLMHLNRKTGALAHRSFRDIVDWFSPGDVLVRNNTRVIPARLYGRKETGGQVECLVERMLSSDQFLAHLKSNKSLKPGKRFFLEDAFEVEVMGREGALYRLRSLDERPVLQLLQTHGHMPLPPYIKRTDELLDQTRYQTVYAKTLGAVAAPTAGLHFDELLLARIQAKGVVLVDVTLHVGAGTFQNIRVDCLNEHVMHKEWIEVSKASCDQIIQARKRGGRVIAVGTTSVRCLESAFQSGVLQPYLGETDLFIRPGYDFHCVDGLITNFHLPESSLLMLVSAFGGYESVRQAYQVAIEERYRFFSYGDAMFIG